jgi:hypothetical protein
MKKCKPGVICIENMTALLFILVLIIAGICFIYLFSSRHHSNTNKSVKNVVIEEDLYPPFFNGYGNGWLPSWPYNNLGLPPPNKDVISNPYVPPLRDERYITNDSLRFGNVPLGRIPINVSTNIGAVDTQYRQLGILTPVKGSSKDNILPLMGRPLFTNRNMWNYFTTSNQHNNVKLPLSRKGRSCTNEYGCDKLYNGDTVYIEGINEAYRITEYDNDTIQYLPAI